MTKLRNQIAANEYSVDPELVAHEILRKVRLIKWARQELVSAPGRNPQQKLRGP